MRGYIGFGLGLLVVVGMCSCRQTGTNAKEELEAGLRARQMGREQSMALYQKGVDAQKAGQLDKAQKHLVESVNADRQNVYAWMALGAVQFDLENYYGAAEAFYEASRLTPSRYEPHYNLGSVYEAVGRYGDAIKAYEAALRLEGDQVEVMENLARVCVRSQTNLDRARELMDRALLRENRPQWRQWLQMQGLRIPAATQPAATRPAGGGEL